MPASVSFIPHDKHAVAPEQFWTPGSPVVQISGFSRYGPAFVFFHMRLGTAHCFYVDYRKNMSNIVELHGKRPVSLAAMSNHYVSAAVLVASPSLSTVA